jgi:hypothetical protein
MPINYSGIPAQNLPFLYDNNLLDSWASNTTLTLSSGQCRDSSNIYDIVLSATVTINAAVSGVNGLDTGTLAASTWYYLYVISDPVSANPTAAILSVNAPAVGPVIPYGYSAWRYIGAWRTDSSSHFLKMWKYGVTGSRKCWWDKPISVLSGGASATFAAVSLVGAIPTSLATTVTFSATVTPTGAGNTAVLRPTGSSDTGTVIMSGAVAAVAQVLQVECPCLIATVSSVLVPAIDYEVTGTLSLSVAAFDDHM